MEQYDLRQVTAEFSHLCSRGPLNQVITFDRINAIAQGTTSSCASSSSSAWSSDTSLLSTPRRAELASRITGVDPQHEEELDRYSDAVGQVDRVVLEPVLAQLYAQSDIVLYTALLESPLFVPKPKMSKRKRRQKKAPPRSAAQVLATQPELAFGSIRKLITKGINERSVVALLIAAKSLLCLWESDDGEGHVDAFANELKETIVASLSNVTAPSCYRVLSTTFSNLLHSYAAKLGVPQLKHLIPGSKVIIYGQASSPEMSPEDDEEASAVEKKTSDAEAEAARRTHEAEGPGVTLSSICGNVRISGGCQVDFSMTELVPYADMHSRRRRAITRPPSRTRESGRRSTIEHPNVRCDACEPSRPPLVGHRFRCQVCADYDLCRKCYEAGKHFADHPFTLIREPNSSHVFLPPRNAPDFALVFVPGITAPSLGKTYYFEVRLEKDPENIRIGLATQQFFAVDDAVRGQKSVENVRSETEKEEEKGKEKEKGKDEGLNGAVYPKLPGSDEHSYAMGLGSLQTFHNGLALEYGHEGCVAGDVVGCWFIVEEERFTVGFTLNGEDLGAAFEEAGPQRTPTHVCPVVSHGNDVGGWRERKESVDVDEDLEDDEEDDDDDDDDEDDEDQDVDDSGSASSDRKSSGAVAKIVVSRQDWLSKEAKYTSLATMSAAHCLHIPASPNSGAILRETVGDHSRFSFDDSDEFTLEAMVYWAPPTETENKATRYTVMSREGSFTFAVLDGGVLALYRIPNEEAFVSAERVVFPNEWCHVAVVYQSRASRHTAASGSSPPLPTRFYVNGVNVVARKGDVTQFTTEAKQTDVTATQCNLLQRCRASGKNEASESRCWCFGAEVAKSRLVNPLSGYLAEVRTWCKARSDIELNANIGRVKLLTSTRKLLFRFKLDESFGHLLHPSNAGEILPYNRALVAGNCRTLPVPLPVVASIDPQEIIAKQAVLASRLDVMDLTSEHITWAMKSAENPISSALVLLLAHMTRLVEEYLQLSQTVQHKQTVKMKLPRSRVSTNAHVLTFLLLHSILQQIEQSSLQTEASSRALLACLRLLNANMSLIAESGIAAASVGLGPSPEVQVDSKTDAHVVRFRRTLQRIAQLAGRQSESHRFGELSEPIAACAYEVLSHIHIFYPTQLQKVVLLDSLLRLASDEEPADQTHFDSSLFLNLIFRRLALNAKLLDTILSKTSPSRGKASGTSMLRWPAAHVTASLRGKVVSASEQAAAANANAGGQTLTKRAVVKYMKEVAPKEWLKQYQLDVNEVVIAKRHTSETIGRFYSLLEVYALSGAVKGLTNVPKQQQTEEGAFSEHKLTQAVFACLSKDPSNEDAYSLLKRLFIRSKEQARVQKEKGDHSEDLDSSASSCLLLGFLQVMNHVDGEEAETSGPEERTKDEGVVERWWDSGKTNLKGLSLTGGEAAPHGETVSYVAMKFNPKRCASIISLSKDGLTCKNGPMKGWGTVMAEQGFAAKTGVHKWRVQINKCNARGHLFIGVATKMAVYRSFLGYDAHSFGILLSGELYHKNALVKRDLFPRGIFTKGSLIEVTLDSNAGTLSLQELGGKGFTTGVVLSKEIVDVDIFANGMLYPAISTYDPRDSVTLIGSSRAMISDKDWLYRGTAWTFSQGFSQLFSQLVSFMASTKQLNDKLESQILLPSLAITLLCPTLSTKSCDEIVPALFTILTQLLQRKPVEADTTAIEVKLLVVLLLGKLSCQMIAHKPEVTNVSHSPGLDEKSRKKKMDRAAHEKWLGATLFSGGLREGGCMDTSHMASVDAKDDHLKLHLTPPKYLSEMLQSQGVWALLDCWVLRHLRFHPAHLVHYGGAEMARLTRAVCLALLYHTGGLQLAHEMGLVLLEAGKGQSLPTHEAIVDAFPDARPHAKLIHVWHTAMELKAWALRYTKGTGSSFQSVASLAVQHVYFLLDFEPCISADLPSQGRLPRDAIRSLRQALALPDKPIHSDSTATCVMEFQTLVRSRSTKSLGFLETSQQSLPTVDGVLSEVVSFLRDSIDGTVNVKFLHALIIAQHDSARRRKAGIEQMARLLRLLPLAPDTISMVVVALFLLPSTLRGWTTPREAEEPHRGWHYLDGLSACGCVRLSRVSEAYDSLGEEMAKCLQAASVAGGKNAVGLLLPLLDVWGTRIEPVDHELLMRVNLFTILHRILEVCRQPDVKEEQLRLELSLVGRATMKLVYLLCSQIAIEPSRSSGRLSRSVSVNVISSEGQREALQHKASLLHTPSLQRMMSGPETLSSSVFKLIFEEMSIAAEDVTLDMHNDEYISVDVDSGRKDVKEQAQTSSLDAHLKAESVNHLKDLTSLLLAISDSENCLEILATKPWLHLLFSLAPNSPASIATRVFRILRKILPRSSPQHTLVPSFQQPLVDVVTWCFDRIAVLFRTLFTPKPEGKSRSAAGTQRHIDTLFSVAAEAVTTVRSMLTDEAWANEVHPRIEELLELEEGALKDGEIFDTLAAIVVLSGGLAFIRLGASVIVSSADGQTHGTLVGNCSPDRLSFEVHPASDTDRHDLDRSRHVQAHGNQVIPVPAVAIHPKDLPEGILQALCGCVAKLRSFVGKTEDDNAEYVVTGDVAVVHCKPDAASDVVVEHKRGDVLVCKSPRSADDWMEVEEAGKAAFVRVRKANGLYVVAPKEMSADKEEATMRSLLTEMALAQAVAAVGHFAKHDSFVSVVTSSLFHKHLVPLMEDSQRPRDPHGLEDVGAMEERVVLLLRECFRTVYGLPRGEDKKKEGKTVEKANKDKVKERQKGKERLRSARQEARRASEAEAGLAREDHMTDGAEFEVELAIAQIVEMGFPRRWAERALSRAGDVTSAITWIVSNGDSLDEEMLQASEESTEEVAVTDVEVTSVPSEKNAEGGEEEQEDTQTESDGYWSEEAELLEENVTDTGYMVDDKFIQDSFASVGLSIHPHGRPAASSVDIDKVFNKPGLEEPSTASRSHSRLLKDRDARLWGPGADSRSAFLALTAQHSKESLFDELTHVLRSMYSLYSRVLILSVLFKLTDVTHSHETLEGLCQSLVGSKESIRKVCESLIEICRRVAFKVYPCYTASVYRRLVVLGGDSQRRSSLTGCCLPFLRLCLQYEETQECIVSSVQTQIEAHSTTSMSASMSSQPRPNLWYSKWVTAYLLTLEDVPQQMFLRFFKLWSNAVFTAALSTKEQTFYVLSAFLCDALARNDVDTLVQMLDVLPADRIFQLTVKRHQAEEDCLPRLSSFLKASVELCTNLKSAQALIFPKQPRPSKFLRFRGCQAALTVSSVAAKTRTRHDPNSLFLQPPWSMSFIVRRAKSPKPCKRKRPVKGRALVSSDRLSALRLLLETEAATDTLTKEHVPCVGVQTAGRQLSLGFAAPVGEWVRLTFICHAITPVRVPTVYKRVKGRKEESLRDEQKQDRVHLLVYMDDKLKGSIVLPFTQANLSPNDIGCNTKAFYGDLRSVAVWRDALPLDTILEKTCWDATATARQHLPGFSSLVLSWNFETSTAKGRVLTDVSGNMVRGVLKGKVGWQSAETVNDRDEDADTPMWPFDTDNTPEDTAGFLASSKGVRTHEEDKEVDETMRSLMDGCRHSGVLTFEPERSDEPNLLARLLEAKSRQKRIQPIELTLHILGDESRADEEANAGGDELVVVHGHVKWQGQINCVCEVLGDYNKASRALTFRACRVIVGPPSLAQAVTGLQFDGEIVDGEIFGDWHAPARLCLLPKLKRGEMRCDVLTIPAQLTPKNGARTLLVNTGKVKAADSFAVVVLRMGEQGDEIAPPKSKEDESKKEAEKKQKEALKNWACPVCTYLNSPDFSSCSMCTTPNLNAPAAERAEPSGTAKKEVWTGQGCLGLGNAVNGSTKCLWDFVVHSKSDISGISVGVCVSETKTNRELGMDAKSWVFALSGHKVHSGLRNEYGAKVKSGERVGVLLDSSSGTTSLSFFVNDVQQGVAFHGLPSPADLAPVIGFNLQKLKPGTTIDVLGPKNGRHVTTFQVGGDYFVHGGFWVDGLREGQGVERSLTDESDVNGYWEKGVLEGPVLKTTSGSQEEYFMFEGGEQREATTLDDYETHCAVKVSLAQEQVLPKPEDYLEREMAIAIGGRLSVSRYNLFLLDPASAGPGVKLSDDCLTAEFVPGREFVGRRAMVLGSRGFQTGIHYWEVKVLGMEWGSTYIGVTEYPTGKQVGSGWGNGFGFVNFRATHGPDGEHLYGKFYAVGDVVGVLLDMDRGTLSFIKDGKEYQHGEKPIFTEMGVAYSQIQRNLLQSNAKKDITLYPCFGFSKRNDKLSLQDTRFLTYASPSSYEVVTDLVDTTSMLKSWPSEDNQLVIDEAKALHERWYKNSIRPFQTVGRLIVELDTSPARCRALCPANLPLVPGDRVSTTRGEAVIRGCKRGCVWYYVEREDLMFYWTQPELKGLVEDGTLKLVQGRVAVEGTEQDNQSKELSIRFERPEGWKVEDDFALVECLNQTCDKLGKGCQQITLDEILAGVHSFKSARLKSTPKAFLCGRFIMIVALNIRLKRILPFVSLDFVVPGQIISNVTPLTGPKLRANLGQCLGNLRGLLLTRSKLQFWDDLIDATTTFTELAADEYENPPGIPTIKINRIRAGEHRLLGLPIEERLKRSVFGQLMSNANMLKWDAMRLRRSYSHIQDAGQKRCFFVKFESEGVDDHGGPYRAVFQLAAEEEPTGSLGLLVPSPNAEGAMQNTDKMVFHTVSDTEEVMALTGSSTQAATAVDKSSFRGLTEAIRLQCFLFLGRLVGVATRHEINVALNLPGLIWRSLVGLSVGWKELHEIDSFTTMSLRKIEMLSKEEWDETWSDTLGDRLKSASTKRETTGVEESTEITYETRSQVINFIVEDYLRKCAKELTEFTRGLSDVLPVEAFPLFTPGELETLICGEPEIDVELLKRATVYENVDENADHVKYFWQALEEMNQEQLAKFINFTCARSRLPSSVDKFPMNFKLQPATGVSPENQDLALPKSQTCFFSLALPEYSSKEICLSKLLYAADNCNTMEDFDEHEAGGFAQLES